MKVMIDAYNLSLSKGTGVATYARNLSESLKELGHEVSVLYDAPVRKTKDDLLKEVLFFDNRESRLMAEPALDHYLFKLKSTLFAATGSVAPAHIPLHGQIEKSQVESRLPSYSQIFNAPHVFLASLAYFKLTGRFLSIKFENPPEIAHWTYPLPIKVPGAKNIYTIHDLVPLKLPFTTLDNKKDYLRLCRKIVETADAIATVSESSKEDICSMLGADPALVHNTYQSVRLPEKHTSVPIEEVSTILRNIYHLESGKYFLFLGAIEPKKNVGRLLEAFLGSDSEFPLVIVGSDGWMADQELSSWNKELDSYLRLEGENIVHSRRIIRLDYVSFPNVLSLLRGARALLFPSLYEGFGLPVLEAMSLGTPVLTSNNSSLREIGEGATVQVDPYDIVDIRGGINRLYTGEDLQDLSKRGQARAQEYSAESVNARLAAMYGSVAP